MIRPVILSLFAFGALAARAVDLPGQRADGSVLLPNQWRLRPIGTQIRPMPGGLRLHAEERRRRLAIDPVALIGPRGRPEQ
ncbi:MAG TPA: hypothetical protein PLU30_13795 [Verrucomicrobiae bacterium]|nr:hypothetical protein [Verrucomicrobiae bacterium]